MKGTRCTIRPLMKCTSRLSRSSLAMMTGAARALLPLPSLRGELHGRREFRPSLQRVRTLAGFYLAIFGFNLVAVLRAERLDGSLLRLQAKTTAALLGF